MKILYYYKDITSYVGSWPKIHFIDELTRFGHSISIFDPDSFSCIDEANEKLFVMLKENKEKYDLFINPYGVDLLYIETIKLIKSYGVPSLLICFDNLHAPYMHKSIAPYFDFVWLTSFETEPMFKKWGCNCIFLPYAANPYTFYPDFTREIKALGFIGTMYGTRTVKINELLTNLLHCEIYSDNICGTSTNISIHRERQKITWKENLQLLNFDVGRKILRSKIKKKFISIPVLNDNSTCLRVLPAVEFKEMNQLYSNFALSLGITEVWDTYILRKPVHKLHLRTFEIPMCGGLQFTPFIDELNLYFDNGKEIILYKDKEEYIDKAKYYLQDKLFDKRMKMKQAARKRAETDHTWRNRFDKIFKAMNLV